LTLAFDLNAFERPEVYPWEPLERTMSTQTTTLYELLGGQTAIEAVVDEFYKRILQDERVAHYFTHLDMERQRNHQSAFIASVLGGPQLYAGRRMAEAHAHLRLSKADFDVVAGHLVAALERFSVSQLHIDAVISKIAALEREIVGQPRSSKQT
jgi:hemoglobin